MKHRIIAGVAAAALATVGLLAVAAPASADSYDGEVCTPAAAWTEVVEIPAVGEPTITVENPDYVPGVPAVTKPVVHPAVTKVVKHEAETHTEYHFAKFTRERTRTFSIYGWGAWSDYGSWSKYSPETHTSWELGTNPIGSPQWHSAGDRNWGTVQWERQWQAQHDGLTRTVEDKAAWDEVVEVTPEWTEIVEVTPAVPAVGEPTKTIDNPDYVPASTRNVEHEAVTCPTGPGHNGNGEATCGAWSITLYNQQAEGYIADTASFVVFIDGQFDQAYAIPGGEQETISGTFAEDSGQHSVIVRSGAAQGDELVFRLDEIKSDCATPPVTEEPEVPTTPTTPVVTPATPLTPAAAPVKAAAASDDTLAQTGDDSSRGLIGFASLLLIAGLGVLGIRRIARH